MVALFRAHVTFLPEHVRNLNPASHQQKMNTLPISTHTHTKTGAQSAKCAKTQHSDGRQHCATNVVSPPTRHHPSSAPLTFETHTNEHSLPVLLLHTERSQQSHSQHQLHPFGWPPATFELQYFVDMPEPRHHTHKSNRPHQHHRSKRSPCARRKYVPCILRCRMTYSAWCFFFFNFLRIFGPAQLDMLG